MTPNLHFKTVSDWKEASRHVDFKPRIPSFTSGYSISSLSIHVIDHRKRELTISRRSLEAHFNGGFVIDQKKTASINEAKRMALSTPYGSSAQTIMISGHEGRSFELGPEVPDTDPDGRAPSVVVWHEDNLFILIASTQLESNELAAIAKSMY